jgi:hypothetical protein
MERLGNRSDHLEIVHYLKNGNEVQRANSKAN